MVVKNPTERLGSRKLTLWKRDVSQQHQPKPESQIQCDYKENTDLTVWEMVSIAVRTHCRASPLFVFKSLFWALCLRRNMAELHLCTQGGGPTSTISYTSKVNWHDCALLEGLWRFILKCVYDTHLHTGPEAGAGVGHSVGIQWNAVLLSLNISTKWLKNNKTEIWTQSGLLKPRPALLAFGS